MNETPRSPVFGTGAVLGRRALLGGLAAAATVAAAARYGPALSQTPTWKGKTPMDTKAFVYTELQISVPFSEVPWNDLNSQIADQPGFLNKTWFAGHGNHSVGGLYSFDSIETARRYCTAFFPTVGQRFGVPQTTRVFDADAVREASLDMSSPHFGAPPAQPPGAFVYTEVQVNLPFAQAPWRDRNPVLKQQTGLLSKLWLSGVDTNTLGGVDAFDTVDNALAFAVDDFPKTAARMNAAFYTRVFDAGIAEPASRGLSSPYYT